MTESHRPTDRDTSNIYRAPPTVLKYTSVSSIRVTVLTEEPLMEQHYQIRNQLV